MATPKAVQRQLEQAEALQAQRAAEAQQQVEVVTDASQLLQLPATPPAEPASVPAPAPPPTPPTETAEHWKSRFNTVQGMYNAEIPALRALTRTQESEIATLKAQVQALMATAKPAEPAKPSFDPDEVERFGQDMLSMVNRHMTNAVTALRSEFGEVLGQLDSRLRQLEGSVQGVTARTEKSLTAQFWDALAQAHPDYEAVNDSDGWKAWLAGTDELTGVQRQLLLNEAHKALDAGRVGKFFTAYKSTLPPKPSAALAGQVSPPSGGAGAAPVAAQTPRVFTKKFVQDFYMELQRGKWKGREAEAERVERDISQAAAEGRIV